MKQEKTASRKKEEAAAGPNWALYAGLGIVVIVAAALFSLGYLSPRPPEGQPPTNATGLSSPAAKLLLSSFDRGEELKDYSLEYLEIDNGAETRYQVARSGNGSFVRVEGGFGTLEGFFGTDNASDVLCLAYGNSTKCAVRGNDSGVGEVAGSLKALLPDRTIYAAQKEQFANLISAGAIVFDGEPVGEEVGGFSVQRISYTLSYRGLTVNQLLSLGISPDDPNVASYADQKVSFWVDRGTGLVVRNLATWKDGLKQESYERIYSRAGLGARTLPSAPTKLVSARTFSLFYQGAVEDYVARETCAAQPTPTERDACFKGEAFNQGNVGLCGRIAEKMEAERCALVVAQEKADASICSNLTELSDDCLIAVAGQNGDFELCKGLKNASLAAQCTQAATEGAKKVAAREEEARKLAGRKNCAVDSDCAVLGSAGQYCMPANTTAAFGNKTSSTDACFKGLPCGCLEGFCGFVKDEAYYACIDKAETAELEDYVRSLAAEAEAKRAANSTNSTNRSK